MERALVDEARVLAWLLEGRYVLHHVLPAILAEHDALVTQLHDAIRRGRALQEENDGLRAERAAVVESMGLFLTQLAHVLEPMRDLAEKLGQPSQRRHGAGPAG